MTEMNLKAEPRSEIKGGNPKGMLKKDILPGVVYGSGIENINIKLNYQEFLKVFNIAGESKVINLTIGDEIKKVFIHKIQKNPITDKITHVDFYQFNKNKKFSVEVPINFVGESKAVKEGGVLFTNIDTILVECLYDDLISEIKVDLSALENINDSIYVSDLKVNEGVDFLTGEDQVIVSVKPMRAEEVIEDIKPEEGAEGEEGASAEGEDSEKENEGDSEKTDEKEKKE
jgi:large subunit ribosomal protein L25